MRKDILRGLQVWNIAFPTAADDDDDEGNEIGKIGRVDEMSVRYHALSIWRRGLVALVTSCHCR